MSENVAWWNKSDSANESRQSQFPSNVSFWLFFFYSLSFFSNPSRVIYSNFICVVTTRSLFDRIPIYFEIHTNRQTKRVDTYLLVVVVVVVVVVAAKHSLLEKIRYKKKKAHRNWFICSSLYYFLFI